ncbi:MAG: hypothetical protein AB7E68_02295 [Candidatus Babeliales bacterium]
MNKKLLLLSLFILSTPSTKPLIGLKQFKSPDAPFKEFFPSFGTGMKEIFYGIQLLLSSNKLDEAWEYKTIRRDKKTEKKLFGYPLKISYIKDMQYKEAHHPTLFFHGWQNQQNSAKILKRYFKILPGDIITFNFPDAKTAFAPFWKSSFGQLPDVLPALYTLKHVVHELNLTAIDLFGISRGAATVVNLIALLHDDTLFKNHEKELAEIGITQQDRAHLLSVILNGSIVLDIPLRSMKDTAAPLSLVSKVTQYKLDGLDAFENAALLGNLPLKILVHFQHKDVVVSNNNEAAYLASLAKNNLHNVYVVMGNDGGHAHTHEALSKTVHLFKCITGSAYDKTLEEKYRNNRMIISSPSDKIQGGMLTTFADSAFIHEALEQYHKTA